MVYNIMLKVSKILTASNIYGWLEPDGTYHEVEDEGHLKFMEEYFGTYEETYRRTFELGWVRVIQNGAETLKWDNKRLHLLQTFLMKQGLVANNRPYYLDSYDGLEGRDIITTTEDLLTANKYSDLARDNMLKVSKILTAKFLHAQPTIRAYHGSPDDFETFDPKMINPNDPDAPYNGFWFTNKEEEAISWAKHPYRRISPNGGFTRAYDLKLDNPATKQQAYAVAQELRQVDHSPRTLQEATRLELMRRGFDGIIHEAPIHFTQELQNAIEAGN